MQTAPTPVTARHNSDRCRLPICRGPLSLRQRMRLNPNPSQPNPNQPDRMLTACVALCAHGDDATMRQALHRRARTTHTSFLTYRELPAAHCSSDGSATACRFILHRSYCVRMPPHAPRPDKTRSIRGGAAGPRGPAGHHGSPGIRAEAWRHRRPPAAGVCGHIDCRAAHRPARSPAVGAALEGGAHSQCHRGIRQAPLHVLRAGVPYRGSGARAPFCRHACVHV